MGFFDFFRRKTNDRSLDKTPVQQIGNSLSNTFVPSKAEPEISSGRQKASVSETAGRSTGTGKVSTGVAVASARPVIKKAGDFVGMDKKLNKRIEEAILTGDEEKLQYFLDNGLLKDLDVSLNRNSDTALHLAVNCNNESSFKFLVRNGATIDVFNGKGETALAVAMRKSQSKLARDLITLKADIFARHNGGEPLIFYHIGKILNGNLDIKRALNPILERTVKAIKSGDGEAFRDWIDGGASKLYQPSSDFEDLKAAYLAAGGDPEIRDIKGHSLDELSRIYRSKARFAEFSTELDRGYCREILSSPELLQEALEIGVLRPKSHVFDVIGEANGTPLQHICELTGIRLR